MRTAWHAVPGWPRPPSRQGQPWWRPGATMVISSYDDLSDVAHPHASGHRVDPEAKRVPEPPGEDLGPRVAEHAGVDGRAAGGPAGGDVGRADERVRGRDAAVERDAEDLAVAAAQVGRVVGEARAVEVGRRVLVLGHHVRVAAGVADADVEEAVGADVDAAAVVVRRPAEAAQNRRLPGIEHAGRAERAHDDAVLVRRRARPPPSSRSRGGGCVVNAGSHRDRRGGPSRSPCRRRSCRRARACRRPPGRTRTFPALLMTTSRPSGSQRKSVTSPTPVTKLRLDVEEARRARRARARKRVRMRGRGRDEREHGDEACEHTSIVAERRLGCDPGALAHFSALGLR